MRFAPGVATAAVVALSAVPPWQFRYWQWVALALTVAVVLHGLLGALRRRSAPADPAVALTAAGALAALGWSVAALLVGGAGEPGMTQPAGSPVLALDAAAVLAALLPLRDDGPPVPGVRVLAGLVPVVAVVALGFRFGAGDLADGVGSAVAVLVAGSPCALLLLPRLGAGPPRVVVAAAHGPDVLRTAGALHVAAGGTAPVGRAVVAAARARHSVLPGVSDPDGDAATGLRGVVSELAGPDRVVAHAALAGPPDWLAAHGVAPTEAAGRAAARGAVVPCVAWDGVARGWLELSTAPLPGTRRRRVAVAVTLAAAALGATAAALGTPAPAAAGAVPAGVALLVAALRALPRHDADDEGHPIGATSG
ncbi:hypothetical protein [Pseudonocardia hydrocarbonoxydans]|uniref:hypothetical protein n=1 Tax=Pseudonocardia hydrocarbonoxydans TaxID=76726 RepID=UPI0031D1C7FE